MSGDVCFAFAVGALFGLGWHVYDTRRLRRHAHEQDRVLREQESRIESLQRANDALYEVADDAERRASAVLRQHRIALADHGERL